MNEPVDDRSGTAGADYTQRLAASVAPRHGWRKWLDPQRPYRWNIRRLHLGRVLDVGCGVGRNLAHLDGNGVGIDHNPDSVAVARARGSDGTRHRRLRRIGRCRAGGYDALLFAHVLEHMTPQQATALVIEYLPYVRPGGAVAVICPQERGQRSDATHVTFMPPEQIESVLAGAGVRVERVGSFPFPRLAGRWFTHNETVVVGRSQPS